MFAVHGGLSPRFETIDQLRQETRNIKELEPESVISDLLWSDPSEDLPMGTHFKVRAESLKSESQEHRDSLSLGITSWCWLVIWSSASEKVL